MVQKPVVQRVRIGGRFSAVMRARRYPLAVTVTFVAVAVFHLLTLLRVPAPFVDDAWYASRAWSLIQQGQAFGTLDAGVLDRYPGYWTYFPLLGPIVQSLGIRLLGLSLFSVRLVSLVFGLMLLAIVYAMGRRIGGRTVALTAALLTAFSSSFMRSSHLARPDIMVVALGYGATLLYLMDRSRHFSMRSALAGLMVGAAFEVHPNGLIFAPAIAALFLADEGWAFWRCARFWAFVGGLGAGLAAYALLHVVRYPATYIAITGIIVGNSRVPPLLTPDVGAWLGSAVVTGLLVCAGQGLRSGLVAAAIASFLHRRSDGERRALLLLLTLMAALAAQVPNKAAHYAILLSPAADLLIALFLQRLWQWRRSLVAQASPATVAAYGLLVLAAAGLLSAATVDSLSALARNPMADYRAVVDRVRQVAPPGGRILGTQTYWLDLADHPYSSFENLAYYQHYAPGSTLEDALRALRPDVLVVDAHDARLIVRDPSTLVPADQFVAISQDDWERFLAQHGRLRATVSTDAFGDVRIYSIDWS